MLAFLSSLACIHKFSKQLRNVQSCTELTNLSEDLVPVFEALEGDQHWPGAPHLWARVHPAGLGDRHLPLDAHVGLDQRGDLTVQPEGEEGGERRGYRQG